MDKDTVLYEIASGNEVAFKCFFDARYEKVLNYLCRITKSREVAEEIALDVFLKLWTNREGLIEIKNIDAYLGRLAYNKAIDFFRTVARTERLQDIIAEKMLPISNEETDHRLLEQEYLSLLNQAIQQLAPQQQVVFRLSRHDGLTHEEIAQQLHLSRHTVRNTIATSLRSIRQFLQSKEVDGLFIVLFLLKK